MRHKQQGSMLMISVFVIVVMLFLGLTLTNLLSASANTVAYEVLGMRALQSAKSGLEQNIQTVFPLDTDGTFDQLPGTCAAGTTQTPAGLPNCQFTASCSAQNYTYDSVTYTYYRFTSTGQCSGGDVLVSRTVAVDAKVN